MRACFAVLLAVSTWSFAACVTTKVEESESFVQTPDGALLHYRKLDAEGAAGDVLLVPGECWMSPDLDRLAKGRTVIFYDMRRRGRSGRASTARMGRDLEDLETVRTWFGLERVSLLGFDYQAALVAIYAAQNPERVDQLVLVSPIPARKFPYWKVYDRVLHERIDHQKFANLRQLDKEFAQQLRPEVWAEAYRETILSGMVVNEHSLWRMKATPLVAENLDPERLRNQYLGLVRALGEWDWRPDLAQIACPTLVVYGAEDPVPLESNAEWAAAIPGARAAVIQKSGRLPWIEKPGDFDRALGGFLDAAR